MVCIWSSLPFSIAILNVELNVGEFVFIFLKSHAPESIHAGFAFLSFCILAIVPVAVLGDTGHFALAIGAMLADVIIATVAATTITMAIRDCLCFRNNNNVRVKYFINIIRHPRAILLRCLNWTTTRQGITFVITIYNYQPSKSSIAA